MWRLDSLRLPAVVIEGAQMADLSVNTASLNAAAANSAAVAGSLVGSDSGVGGGSQPSRTGVAAIRASVAGARQSQSLRGSQHATNVQSASAVYAHVDDGSSEAITRTI